jgi:hypothetical protein
VAGDGVYLVKLATVTCGEQRNMSEGIVVTFGDYGPPTTPIPAPPTPPTPPSENPPGDDPPSEGPTGDEGNNDEKPNTPSSQSACDLKYQGVGTVTGSPNGIVTVNSNGTVKLDAQLRNGTFGLGIEYFKNG